jgi:DUF4097 and DUF4098 domain-containing protein YvlB
MKRSIVFLVILFFLVLLTTNAWAERVEKVMEENFLLNSTGSFSLANIAGKIEIYSWDKEEARMLATKSISSWGIGDSEEMLDNIEIEIVSQPKNLKINTRYPALSWVKNARVEYQIWIPQTCTVELESVSGSIQMADHLNRVYAKTVSGSIKLNNIMGNVELKTVSGNISIAKISGEIRAGSVSGSLIFRDCKGSFPDLHSTSGSIVAELAAIDEDASDMSLNTVSGDINLKLPGDASFGLDIKTVSGEINNKFKVLVESVKKNQLQGEVGNGGINIELKTISGDISLAKL